MKLIRKERNARIYQLDFRVFVTANGTPIKDIFQADPIKFKEGFELAEDITESIDKVCISDAHTHVERLAFPAFNVRDINKDETFVSMRCNTLSGHMTFMSHGGNSRSVHPDKVYIRHLRMLNRGYNEDKK